MKLNNIPVNQEKIRLKTENIEAARKEVEIWGKRVLFWAEWNNNVIRNDPYYEKILEVAKDTRLKAFNRYLKMVSGADISACKFRLEI